VVPDTIEKGKAQPASSGPKTYGAGKTWGNKAGGGFQKKSGENFEARQKYWEDKERRDIEVVEPRITFAAAQRDAIEIVRVALDKDMLSFGNSSKAAKLPMLLDFVDEVTARFYEQRINARATAEALCGVPQADSADAEESDDE
jgi:hypothetical protein